MRSLDDLPVIAPMLATAGAVTELETGEPPRWGFEVKWDGYRAVAAVVGDGPGEEPGDGPRPGGTSGSVRLRSRSGNDLTAAYPELAELARLVVGHTAVLDGEVVALDAQGRASFSRLQHRGDPSRGIRAHYMAFDLLHLDGVDLLTEPYRRRRALLEALLPDGEHVHVPPSLGVDLDIALDVSRSLRLEGIVAKRLDGPYLPGRRSRSWIKIKHLRTQEVVVVGWSPGTGRRADTLGALLLAVPGAGGDEWEYVGKVGTGFSDRDLRQIRVALAPLTRATPVARDVPRPDGIGAHWVQPDLVGEVAYGEWTATGRLRHPVWRGWRPDKTPYDVRREP